jgi:hypothetical protein
MRTAMNEETPGFRLTYATMFDPPASLHAQFDAALARVRPLILREQLQTLVERGSVPSRGPVDGLGLHWLVGRPLRR